SPIWLRQVVPYSRKHGSVMVLVLIVNMNAGMALMAVSLMVTGPGVLSLMQEFKYRNGIAPLEIRKQGKSPLGGEMLKELFMTTAHYMSAYRQTSFRITI